MSATGFTEISETESARARHPSLAYQPGLDGLRALAIVAVLLYHADLPWIPGGFLGVDVFFALSGYLITSLLLVEWRRRGALDLGAFWLRRARRLVPALLVLVGVALGYAVLFLPDEVASLRGDALAAVAYASNWHLVFSRSSYFETMGRPSLLRHLWSLGVEGQFYLLWPLCFCAAMRRGSRRRLLLGVLVGAAASALLMALLYDPYADPSRVYFGTDTRATALLAGAALALAWMPGELGGRAARISPVALDATGLACVAALAAGCLWIDEFQPLLYRGGLAGVALVTALAIGVSVHPRARLLPRLLGAGPLRWLAQRSYALYLWHWPVFMVTRPDLDLPLDGLALLALRLMVTGILAELSYRCVETPFRAGALRQAWGALRAARGRRRLRLGAEWAGSIAALAVVCAVLGEPVVTAERAPSSSYLSVVSVPTAISARTPTAMAASPAAPPVSPPVRAATTWTDATLTTKAARSVIAPHWLATGVAMVTVPPQVFPLTALTPTKAPLPASVTATPTPTSVPAAVDPLPDLARPTLTEAIPQPATPTARPYYASLSHDDDLRAGSRAAPAPRPTDLLTVTAIGDSVMLGAVAQLKGAVPHVQIDAAIGRQAPNAVQTLRALGDADQLGAVVVIHLGSNGIFRAEQFDEIMQALKGIDRVLFVNVRVARRWQDPVNKMIVEAIGRYPHAALVDWYTASADQPELLKKDGVHLTDKGARAYAALIATSVQGLTAQGEGRGVPERP